MYEIFLHSLQSILSAGLFILIYRLFIRNTNAYNWNRCYLLTTMILSLFLPFIDISNWFTVDQPIIFYASMINLDQAFTVTPVQQTQASFNLSDFILTGYWLIVGLFLLRFGWGILRIIKMARSNNYSKSGNLRLYPIQRKTTFSFFNYIFIQPEHWKNPAIDYIIRHEQAHVNQLHSIDNILTELILVFGWFNPFYYIYRNDLHLLHECQADQTVINSGCDQTTYHQILLNEVSGNLTYIIVSQFSYSLIKRRFKMISKNKQSRLAGFRILLAIPTAFALLLMFSFTSLEKTTFLLQNNIIQPTIQAVNSSLDNLQNTQQKLTVNNPTNKTVIAAPPQNDKSKDSILDEPEDFGTQYPGGYTAWTDLVKQNLNSNLITQKTMEGPKFMVITRFFVTKTGEITNLTVINGMNEICDNEAIRLVKMMPKLKPLIRNGKPCTVCYILPIRFKEGPAPIEAEEKPFTSVEQNPDFKGGYEAMLNYLKENIKYPELAKKSGIQGMVFVYFVISKTGKISNVKILRGIGGGCDEEAIRIVQAMPDWIPGRNGGKAVSVVFQIPIKFSLKAD